MKKIVLILYIVLCPVFAWGQINTVEHDDTKITTSLLNTIKMANALVDQGDTERAKQILNDMPKTKNESMEIERLFLIGKIAQQQNDYDQAIEIYSKILNIQPNLARARYELASCYIHNKQWSRADYHLRLAMAGKNLSDDMKTQMDYYRYFIRKNKNWDVRFRFGTTPDSNVNNGNGGQECIIDGVHRFCRDAKDLESIGGTNLSAGGDYEFKLSEHWRWKTDASLYTDMYDKSGYDDLYLSASTGPRYVWSRGDVWLAGVGAQRWYNEKSYNHSYGSKIDANYDFTRKLYGGMTVWMLDNKYEHFGNYLNSQVYATDMRLTYSFDARMYATIKIGATREDAKSSSYSYWEPNISFGFGIELPYGFYIYAEPAFYWFYYDANQWAIKDGVYTQIEEQDFMQKYSLSLSNNRLEFLGFTPTIILSYSKKDSNIWHNGNRKTSFDITLRRRF